MINPEGHPGNPVEPSGFSINNRSWQWPLYGRRTQPPAREHPCS